CWRRQAGLRRSGRRKRGRSALRPWRQRFRLNWMEIALRITEEVARRRRQNLRSRRGKRDFLLPSRSRRRKRLPLPNRRIVEGVIIRIHDRRGPITRITLSRGICLGWIRLGRWIVLGARIAG